MTPLTDAAALSEAEWCPEANRCRSQSGGYDCTRPAGHGTEHIACDFARVVSRWPQVPQEDALSPADIDALAQHPVFTRATDWRYACPECGNKRCPRTESDAYRCTGSNEPGQVAEPDRPDTAAEATERQRRVDAESVAYAEGWLTNVLDRVNRLSPGVGADLRSAVKDARAAALKLAAQLRGEQ